MSTTDPSPTRAREGRRLVVTNTPGIYRRKRADGSLGGYVVIYRAAGRQRKESARTLAEARAPVPPVTPTATAASSTLPRA
ncbi:MAG: hypothetical protein WKF33_08060 [Thermoleophilaceae bacterium]